MAARKGVYDTLTRTELRLLNMHGIKMDKRENLIEEAQEFLTAELMDIDGIDIEASKDDVEFMLLCARKVGELSWLL